jgi:hypothetical protein
MANEGYFTLTLQASKNGATVSDKDASRFDMTGDDMIQVTQLIGTSSETVTFTGITGAPQMVKITNLDAANFIEIGGDSGLTVFKLKILPGMSNLVSLSSATLYAIADTAAVRIQIVAIEA